MIDSVAGALLNLLRAELPPLLPAERIGLCSPAERRDTVLGLYLYDIEPDRKPSLPHRVAIGERRMQSPPLCVSVSFMVTSYAGLKSSVSDDYKLLGRVLQILAGHPTLPALSGLQPEVVPSPRVELLELNAEEKQRQFPGQTPALSLYYRVQPVVIPSEREWDVTRVAQMVLDGIYQKEESPWDSRSAAAR